MLEFSLTKEGSLFKPNPLKRIISDAVIETTPYAKGAIQSFTPVRTGTLKNAWQATALTSSIKLENDTNYCIYVEARFNMIEQTVPLVQNRLVQAINKRLYKLNLADG